MQREQRSSLSTTCQSTPHLWKSWVPVARDMPNYLELGLGPEHISDLIHMVADETLNDADSDDVAGWAPMHAYRALAQLHTRESDWASPISLRPLLETNDLPWRRCQTFLL